MDFGFIVDTKPSDDADASSSLRSRFPVFRKSKYDIKHVDEDEKSDESDAEQDADEFHGKFDYFNVNFNFK